MNNGRHKFKWDLAKAEGVCLCGARTRLIFVEKRSVQEYQAPNTDVWTRDVPPCRR